MIMGLPMPSTGRVGLKIYTTDHFAEGLTSSLEGSHGALRENVLLNEIAMPWESCAASLIFQTISLPANIMDLIPQPLGVQPHSSAHILRDCKWDIVRVVVWT